MTHAPALHRHRIICTALVCALLWLCRTCATAQLATFTRTDYPLFANNHIAVDLNGDGKLDLAGGGADAANIMLGNGDGTFRPKVAYPVASGAQYVAAGDLNMDGRVDLVVTLVNPSVSVAILLGNGDGSFGTPQYIANTSAADSPFVVVTDLNNDGKLDLAVTHEIVWYATPVVGARNLSIYLGNGDGTFQAAREIPVGLGMAWMAAGDFNRDGIKDLASAGSSGQAYILIGRGDATFVQQTLILDGPNALGVDTTDVGVADFNADGFQDVVFVIGLNGSRTAVVLGNGDGTFRAPLILSEPQQWTPQHQAVADYNGDGKLDIALGLGYGTQGLIDIWYGNGDGTFQPPVLYFKPPVLSSIGGGVLIAADFNGDSKPDIALQIVGNSPPLAILLNGTGAIVPTIVSSLSINPTTVTGGSGVTGTATLSAAARTATTITLTSSSTTVTVPGSVIVPAGATSVTFPVTTKAVTAQTVVTITAGLNGSSRSAGVTVKPATTTTDTVSIGRAEYERSKGTLRVEASSTSSSATLTAYVTSSGSLIGTLKNNGGGKYSGNFSLSSSPINITIKSNLLGTASKAVTLK